MPRESRALAETGLYHVTSRGNDKRRVFNDVPDRQVFVAFTRQAAELAGWTVLSWCLIGNHFHLLVASEPAGLSEGMGRLKLSYTKYFHRRYETSGHLWGGRFAHGRVASESHLVSTFRYIASNPVEAGLVARAGDWVWSAHRALAGQPVPDFVDVDAALTMLGGDPERGRLVYTALAGDAGEPRMSEPSILRPGVATLLGARPSERDFAVARVVYGYTPDEIAEEMGVSVRTVRRLVAAGHDALGRSRVAR